MALRLVRTPLDSTFTPEQALLTLRDDARPFALVGDWAGGGALVGSEPVRRWDAALDPLDAFDEQPEAEGTGGVGGGWVGWLGYGVAARVERVPPPPPRPVPLPAASLAFYDHLLRLDSAGRWWFEALWSDERAAALTARRDILGERLAATEAPRPRAVRVGAVGQRPAAGGHAEAVHRCREYIAAGDLYQANLTLRLEASLGGEAIDLFARTAAELAPRRGAYVGDADAQVVSLSPELFLERRGRDVRTAPIKGTVRRTGDPAELAALEGSAKDGAEHVMIVDLMRNDLGRVSAYGSVRAAERPRAEPHPGVWHLVSDVAGRLRDGVGDADLLRATFPPGSVTGAPKIKALEVIATLESTGREAYTGAIGFASPVAGLELSVAIRTFEVSRGRAWLGVGGGIVADSDPEAELREALDKAAPLLRAAGAELPRPVVPARAAVPPPVRTPRPDPAAGVIETLLAADGVVLEADRHVRRLRAAMAAVLGRPLDPAAAWRVAEAARGTTGMQRVRVHAHGATALEVTCDAADPERVVPVSPVELVPVTLPGGAGPHKWADRRLLDEVADGREALLVDLDGAVLETGRGTVWIREGETLVTPPADGRILDGTVRGVVLDHAGEAGLRVRVERVDLDRLAAADEVVVTSSIRLVQAAHLADRPAPAAPGSAGTLLAALLVERWGLPVALPVGG